MKLTISNTHQVRPHAARVGGSWFPVDMTRHRKQATGDSWTMRLEELARQIVTAESDVSAEPYDIRGVSDGSGRADFTLHNAEGGLAGLLEVTSATDPDMNRTQGSLARAMPRKVENSRFYWYITLDGTRISVSGLRRGLVSILNELERSVFAGVTDHERVFIRAPAAYDIPSSAISGEINDELHGLGVLGVTVLANVEPEDRGQIEQATVSGFNMVGPDAITGVVNAELQKRDNQKKLAKAGAGKRAELFIWLDTPKLRIAAFRSTNPNAFGNDKLIGRPDLPKGITAVWVAPIPTDEFAPYWYSDGGPWHARTWRSSNAETSLKY